VDVEVPVATQLVQNNLHNPFLDCSLRTAKAAALLITSLRGVPFAVPQQLDWEILLDLAQRNSVATLIGISHGEGIR
jgi:hypothetical protein